MKNKTSKAAIITFLKLPGYLNLQYGKNYHFDFEGRRAVVGLNKLTKGVQITDNENHLRDGGKCMLLHKPLVKFDTGHVFFMAATKTPNAKVPKEDGLQFSMETDAANARDIFTIERFYTEYFIMLQFDNFDLEVYNDDKKRERYNRVIINAFNHFCIKYNLASNSGNISTIIHTDKGSNTSYILRQTYCKIETPEQFEQFTKSQGWGMEAKSFIIENVGTHGLKSNNLDVIKQISDRFEKTLNQRITVIDVFLSNALEQFMRLNFRYAYLEAFLAIEVSVEEFLTARKKSANIPKNILADYSRETGIAYKTNIEIPLTLGKVDKEYNELLTEINGIRKIRNNIVHRGDEIAAEQAKHAIDQIRLFVAFLQRHSTP